jgi:hypothetical protein
MFVYLVLSSSILIRILQALMASQLQNQQAINDLRLVKNKYEELRIKYESLRAKGKSGHTKVAMNDEDKIISLFAKKFATMYEPWIDENVLDSLSMTVPPLDAKTRYSTQANRTLGVIADLQQSIPPAVRDIFLKTNRLPSIKRLVRLFII